MDPERNHVPYEIHIINKKHTMKNIINLIKIASTEMQAFPIS